MVPQSSRKPSSPTAGTQPVKTAKTAKASKAAKTGKTPKAAKVLKAGATSGHALSPKASSKTGGARTAHLPRNENGIVLLSGGNPQIPKGDGDAPVQLYIANMPGWKSALGKRLDALIVKAVPEVEKAVRWNSPFYGAGQGWFLSFHVLTKYVKVTFFKGTSLDPMPPGSTAKSGEARWIDIYEDDVLDEKRFTDWVRQAARIPGWTA